MRRELLKIKFVTIDDWNRPIFKSLDKSKRYYLSDVNNLFNYGTSEEQIKEFYKDLKPLREYITLHGICIDVDPHGGHLEYDLEIV